MFTFYNITDSQRHEINIWADSVIKRNKNLMSSSKNYLLWSNGLYYQPGKDTWADELWWIKIARQLFAKHKDNNDGTGIDVIPALEILVNHFPAEYGDFARERIDRHLNQAYHDPEYWWGLMMAACPDHPAIKYTFENHHVSKGTLEIVAGSSFMSQLSGIYFVYELLKDLGINNLSKRFSSKDLDKIKLVMIEIAKKELVLESDNSRKYKDQDSILPIAILMKWPEVIDALKKNSIYLERLLYEFKRFRSSDTLLLWSITDNNMLTENLALQLYNEICMPNKSFDSFFPSHNFSLAIAWKRSQSKS